MSKLIAITAETGGAPMAETGPVSLRKFAALQGWNPGHAHKLKVAGRLVMVTDAVGRELVDVARSLERIAASADPQKGYMTGVNAKQRAKHRSPAKPAPAEARPGANVPGNEPAAPDIEAPEQGSRSTTYTQARTAQAVYSAKLSQLEYELQSGRLINADAVRAEFAKVIIGLRDRLLRLPDRLVVIIQGETDPRRLRVLIDAEVRATLVELSTGGGL